MNKEKMKVLTVQFNEKNKNKKETYEHITIFNCDGHCISFIQRLDYGMISIVLHNEAISNFLVEEE